MLDGFGVPVRGTFHKPYGDSFGLRSNLAPEHRVGVVFLNGLSATRSSNGDAAVSWADSFAERGYPSFRIDLPGFGDSEGDPPSEWLAFVNQGGYTSIASAKVDELVARFDLSGIILVGHCAGAISALYTAGVSRKCKGLVLMEPYFHLPQGAPSKVREQLHVWALQNKFGGFLSNIFDLLKQIRLFFYGNMPPENANLPLLRCWRKLATTDLPILILKAPSRKVTGRKSKVGEFDYIEYIVGLAGRRNRVTVKVLDDANHSFANRLGRAALRQQTASWLHDFFIRGKQEKQTGGSSSFESVENTLHEKLHDNSCTGNLCV